MCPPPKKKYVQKSFYVFPPKIWCAEFSVPHLWHLNTKYSSATIKKTVLYTPQKNLVFWAVFSAVDHINTMACLLTAPVFHSPNNMCIIFSFMVCSVFPQCPLKKQPLDIDCELTAWQISSAWCVQKLLNIHSPVQWSPFSALTLLVGHGLLANTMSVKQNSTQPLGFPGLL